MVSFEIFVKAMPPSLSKLKVLLSFCFAFKIPDDRAVTRGHMIETEQREWMESSINSQGTSAKTGHR